MLTGSRVSLRVLGKVLMWKVHEDRGGSMVTVRREDVRSARKRKLKGPRRTMEGPTLAGGRATSLTTARISPSIVTVRGTMQ